MPGLQMIKYDRGMSTGVLLIEEIHGYSTLKVVLCNWKEDRDCGTKVPE